MKIQVFMMTRDRSVKRLKVSDAKRSFEFRRGIYDVPVEAVNLSQRKSGLTPIPELVYVEGNPIPQTRTKQTGEELGTFMDDTIIENAIRQTAQPSWGGFTVMGDMLKNPGRLMGLAMVLLVVGSVAYQLVIGF